jgi:hypothetical protein
VSIKNGPYKDTGYNGHNKTHDEDKQNKNAQHNAKNLRKLHRVTTFTTKCASENG